MCSFEEEQSRTVLGQVQFFFSVVSSNSALAPTFLTCLAKQDHPVTGPPSLETRLASTSMYFWRYPWEVLPLIPGCSLRCSFQEFFQQIEFLKNRLVIFLENFSLIFSMILWTTAQMAVPFSLGDGPEIGQSP